MQRLLQRRQRLLNTLPPLEDVLRGSIVERSLRCGRRGCRCASGDGHAVTYFSVTVAGGRTEQISLPASVVATARRGVAVYQKWWTVVEQVSAINRQLLRQQREETRAAPRPRGGGGDGSRTRLGRGGKRAPAR
jgi:hypothetical protein